MIPGQYRSRLDALLDARNATTPANPPAQDESEEGGGE